MDAMVEDHWRENEESLKNLLMILPVRVSIVGKDKRPLYTNLTLSKILGLSDEELATGTYASRKYLRGDGTEMPPEEFPSSRVFAEGAAVENVEIGIVKEDEGIIWTLVSAIPFNYGEWRVVLTVSDTTHQKNVESSLQQKTFALTERVKELNCIYSIGALVEKPGVTLDEILQGTIDLIPPAWRFPLQTKARIYFEGKTFVSQDFSESPHQQTSEITVHGNHVGALEVFYLAETETNPFLDEEWTLLNSIARRIGRIVERIRAEQLLQHFASTDPLTGLINRRHFFELAEQEVVRAIRYERSLSCIMFDIDDFKCINDTFGHLFGDQVLKGVVKRCSESIREADIFSRYGGDEYVILLPETELANATQLAERLCLDFQTHPLVLDARDISVTLSLGVASMSGAAMSLDVLLSHADEALYKAKVGGRNRIANWEEA